MTNKEFDGPTLVADGNPNASLPPVEVTLFNIRQAAKVLGVSTRTVEYLIADGDLETVHIGRSVRIWIEDLRGLIMRLRSVRNSTATSA